MEFQHGLLVVQESITLISVLLNHTRLSSSQHQLPQRSNNSDLLVNGLAIKAFFVTFRRFLSVTSRPVSNVSARSVSQADTETTIYATLQLHSGR